jgi:hypothetical protein
MVGVLVDGDRVGERDGNDDVGAWDGKLVVGESDGDFVGACVTGAREGA